MKTSMAWLFLLCAAILVLLNPNGSLGQKQLATDQALKQAFDKSRESFSRLLNKKEAPAAGDQPHLDAICKYYIYRTTLTTWQNKPDDLAKLMVEFDRSFIDRVLREGHKEMVNLTGKLLAKRFGDVLDLDFLENRQACVLAAAMLPLAAKLKQDDFGEYLVKLIQDPKRHDAIKLYALRGLREFFPIQLTTDEDDPKDQRIQQRKSRDIQRVQVVLDFLDRKWPANASASKEETEAVRYLRKEALATLAFAQWPVVYIDRKGTRVEGPAVYGLVKPLVKDRLQPPPSVAEKCEAALGLCGLKTAPALNDYQADAGVYLVGKGLLALADGYREDLGAIVGQGQDKKPPRLAWKVYAERFLQELKTLEANARGTTANAAAKALASSARDLLLQMKVYQQIDVRELEKVVNGLRPKTNTLFKKVKDQPQFEWDM